MDSLLYWDQQLLIFLNNLGSPEWDTFWLIVTNKFTWFPMYALALYLIYKYWGPKVLVFAVLSATLLVVSTDQLSLYFKNDLVQRYRPCRQPGVQEYLRILVDTCNSKYGFFSGHATNHFGIATYLGLIFKNKIKGSFLFLLLTAFIVAYSRVYLGVHYVLDVIVGAVVGSLLGLIYFKVYQYLNIKYA